MKWKNVLAWIIVFGFVAGLLYMFSNIQRLAVLGTASFTWATYQLTWGSIDGK